MDIKAMALAVLRWVMSYVWWVWNRLVQWRMDPPEGRVWVYFGAWIASFIVGAFIVSKGWDWADNKLASMIGLSSSVQPLLSGPVDAPKEKPTVVFPELPDVVTTRPPVKVEVKPDEPAKKADSPKASKVAGKPKRKKKQAATSDPWQF